MEESTPRYKVFFKYTRLWFNIKDLSRREIDIDRDEIERKKNSFSLREKGKKFSENSLEECIQ